MTADKFAKMYFLMARSKNLVTTKETIQAWYDILKDIPGERLQKAFMRIIYDKDIFNPNVGHVIHFADNEKDPEIVAAEGWTMIMEGLFENKKLTGPLSVEFLKGYGGQRELKVIIGDVTKIPQIRSRWMEFCKAKLKGQKAKKADAMIDKLLGGNDAPKLKGR